MSFGETMNLLLVWVVSSALWAADQDVVDPINIDPIQKIDPGSNVDPGNRVDPIQIDSGNIYSGRGKTQLPANSKVNPSSRIVIPKIQSVDVPVSGLTGIKGGVSDPSSSTETGGPQLSGDSHAGSFDGATSAIISNMVEEEKRGPQNNLPTAEGLGANVPKLTELGITPPETARIPTRDGQPTQVFVPEGALPKNKLKPANAGAGEC